MELCYCGMMDPIMITDYSIFNATIVQSLARAAFTQSICSKVEIPYRNNLFCPVSILSGIFT